MSVKVSFLLTQPGADKPTPIFAFVAFDGQRVKVYTGLSIHPKYWIKEEQAAKTRGYAEGGRVNTALDGQRENLLACYNEARAAGQLPTAEQLRQAVEPEQAPEPAPEASKPAPELLAVFADWMEARKSEVRENTLRANRTTLHHLREFAERKGYAVRFDTLTPTFGNRYRDFLLTDKGLLSSVVQKDFAILKTFLRWAGKHGHPTGTDFQEYRQKFKEPDIITLTLAELEALAALDLTGRPGLENARAFFLLACYTGLRFSDVQRLRPENIGADFIKLTTKKTDSGVYIPLRPEAAPIVSRLLAGDLRAVSSQKTNAHLKELGQLAGIDTPTEKVRQAGTKQRKQTAPKWQFLTFHTARRTFTTLALEAGMRPEVVMKMTGHEGYKSFQRYINVSPETLRAEFAKTYGAAVVAQP